MPRNAFSACPNRRGSGSLKWDAFGDDANVLQLWVADMDLQTAPEIREALHSAISDGVLGYSWPLRGVKEATVDYLNRHHKLKAEPHWLQFTPGLGFALHIIGQVACTQNESLITLTPIYPPFMGNPRRAGIKVIEVPLGNDGNRSVIDFDKLDAACAEHTRMFYLCNPHNPVGRAYTREELTQLAEWCLKRDLLICSDEVHADLILDDSCSHIPFASLSPEISKRTITINSPSKAYNIPGLVCAYAITEDPTLRRSLLKTTKGFGLDIPTLGLIGCEAAYRHGRTWLEQEVLPVLQNNRDHIEDRLGKLTPHIKIQHLEATYLAWIDCRSLPVEDPHQYFLKEAHIRFSDGADFAAPGFVRMNFATDPARVEEALIRIEKAVNKCTT